MSALDTAIYAIPLWITTAALALGAALGWAAAAAAYARRARRARRSESVIADLVEQARAQAEATEQMIWRLGLDSSGPITAIADAVTDYEIGAEDTRRGRPGGAHRAQ